MKKRIIGLLLSLVMVVTMLPALSDTLHIRSRLEELTAAQMAAADLDKDGVVTVADGVLISRVLAGLETVE